MKVEIRTHRIEVDRFPRPFLMWGPVTIEGAPDIERFKQYQVALDEFRVKVVEIMGEPTDQFGTREYFFATWMSDEAKLTIAAQTQRFMDELLRFTCGEFAVYLDEHPEFAAEWKKHEMESMPSTT